MHRLQHCVRRSLPAVVKSEQPSGPWFFCGQVPSCANLLHSFVHKPSDPCWVFFERSARLGWAEEKRRNLLYKNEKTRSVRGKTGFMSEQQAGYSAVTNRLPRCFSVEMHAAGKQPPAFSFQRRCVALPCAVLLCQTRRKPPGAKLHKKARLSCNTRAFGSNALFSGSEHRCRTAFQK